MIRERVYPALRLINGDTQTGPWRFDSDGTIGAYPRFVRSDGAIVPWHAVLYVHGQEDPT